ncbi:tetrapyrrole methylase family protein / MazG family protein [Halolactibacillus halophilus]|uniref:MazG family protein n=1 Tax=Halolactibacillus halophilus TaxID=306540 RepID=A0A1I5R361_9BACI|nr:MazG family protein [Halolactibacillus halophilus]GEM02281.1 MazG family protein [Halolactibacillus halophilus]SFP52800.1 tetrapyrrole methylase family protein / MazG family protein [Halolactibacillus halophilus]
MGMIQICGLGGGDLEQLSVGLYQTLTNYKGTIYARTIDHPVIETLTAEGVTFQSFDDVYTAHDRFEEVYQTIAEQLIYLSKASDILYAVPGHPMLAEKTVQLLLAEATVEVEIIGGQSYLDDLFRAVKLDPIDGFSFLDATDLIREDINYHQHLVFCQVYDQMIASELKLTLMEDLPDDYPVTVVEAAGAQTERIETVPLYDLDRAVTLSNLTSIYVKKPEESLLSHQFDYIRQVIYRLRAPGGCPWDQKQTHESLRHHLIEEAYELIDAINAADDDGIIEELGDVLLQVLLHSQIGEDSGYFSVDDVIRTLSEKMIRRHPHVFGDVTVSGEADVIANWQAIKAKEKANRQSVFDRIPKSASPLVKAEAISKTITDLDEPAISVNEALIAFRESDTNQKEHKLGALLFALITEARYDNIKSDVALESYNQAIVKQYKDR